MELANMKLLYFHGDEKDKSILGKLINQWEGLGEISGREILAYGFDGSVCEILTPTINKLVGKDGMLYFHYLKLFKEKIKNLNDIILIEPCSTNGFNCEIIKLMFEKPLVDISS